MNHKISTIVLGVLILLAGAIFVVAEISPITPSLNLNGQNKFTINNYTQANGIGEINNIYYVNSGNASDIQTKINSCNAGKCEVRISKGTYNVDRTINMTSNLTIVVEKGALIRFNTGATPTFLTDNIGGNYTPLFYANAVTDLNFFNYGIIRPHELYDPTGGELVTWINGSTNVNIIGGTIGQANDGYGIHNSQFITVKDVFKESTFAAAAVWLECSKYATIDTVRGYGIEAVDLNGGNENIDISNVNMLTSTSAQEVIDIGSSRNVNLNNIIGTNAGNLVNIKEESNPTRWCSYTIHSDDIYGKNLICNNCSAVSPLSLSTETKVNSTFYLEINGQVYASKEAVKGLADSTQIDRGLLLSYGFEENNMTTNESLVYDDSNNGFNVAKVGTFNTIQGVKGLTYDFQGNATAGNYLKITDPNFYPSGGSTTTCLAFKFHNVSDGRVNWLINHQETATNNRFYFDKEIDGSLRLTLPGSYVTIANASNGDFSNDQWLHACIVRDYDNARKIVYFNGLQVDNSAMTAPAGQATVDVYIGGTVDLQNYLNGSIDEFRIYNRTLSPAEARAVYFGSYPKAQVQLQFQAKNWTDLQNYPVACPAGSFISQLGDSVICTSPSSTNYNNFTVTNLNVTGNVTSNLVPSNSWSLGSSILRWLKGWFTDIDVSGTANIVNLTVTGQTNIQNVSVININKSGIFYPNSNGISSYGLVGFWNAETLDDHSGNGNNISASGGIISTSGKFGKGFESDHTNKYFTTNNVVLQNNLTSYSLIGWAKKNSGTTAAYNMIVRTGSSGLNAVGMGLNEAGTALVCVATVNATEYMVAKNHGKDQTQWHQYGCVFENSNIMYYIDGINFANQSTSTNTAINLSTMSLAINARPGGTQNFNGTTDEILVYNRSLSNSEMKSNYEKNIEFISPEAYYIKQTCVWESNITTGLICSGNKVLRGVNLTSEQGYCC